MAHIVISSPTNQTIKDLIKLKSRKGERASQSFLVEGWREIDRALKQNFKLEDFFYCEALLDAFGKNLVKQLNHRRTAEVSQEAFSKVATRENSDGFLAVFSKKDFSFDDILRRAGKKDPLIIVLENVEKPGNLGAVLRTADGSGVHGVVTLGVDVDIWNPNVIRASLGGVFAVPTLNCSYDKFFEWCRSHRVKTMAAAISDRSKPIFDMDLNGPLAVILGSEASGVSKTVLEKTDEFAVIPMNGVCDSLNVSVAAGIFMYEAFRQRSTT